LPGHPGWCTLRWLIGFSTGCRCTARTPASSRAPRADRLGDLRPPRGAPNSRRQRRRPRRRAAAPIPRPRTPIPILVGRTQPRRRRLLRQPTATPRTRPTIASPVLGPLIQRLPRTVHMPKIPGVPGTIGRPHRAHTAAPDATTRFHCCRSFWCLHPYPRAEVFPFTGMLSTSPTRGEIS